MERNKSALENQVPRSVDHFRFVAFNDITVGMFFAQVSAMFGRYRIKDLEQIYNFDETVFFPRREFTGARSLRVVTEAGKDATIPKLSFSYANWTSIVVYVRAVGNAVCPAAVFKRVCILYFCYCKIFVILETRKHFFPDRKKFKN